MGGLCADGTRKRGLASRPVPPGRDGIHDTHGRRSSDRSMHPRPRYDHARDRRRARRRLGILISLGVGALSGAGPRVRRVGLTLVPALLHQFPPAHRPGPGAQPQGPGARARLGPRASVITYLCADYRVHGLESATERPVRDRVTTCLISHDTCYKWH